MSVIKTIKGGLTKLKENRASLTHIISLSPVDTGFFQKYTSDNTFKTQLLTTGITPIIGVYTLLSSIFDLVKNILGFLLFFLCDESDPFAGMLRSLSGIVGALISIVVTPIITAAMTLSSFVSIFTRSIGTIIDHDGSIATSNLEDFLHKL